jgi:beta-phosphoglucomutase-like phosphatase (HAD superfamily)
MRGFDLVIFDCDGVLVDSMGNCAQVARQCAYGGGLAPTTMEQARAECAELLLAGVVARAEERLERSLPADWLSAGGRDR